MSEEYLVWRSGWPLPAAAHVETRPIQVFQTSPKIILLAVMLYVRFPLSLRNVEDFLDEQGIDVGRERSGSGGDDWTKICIRNWLKTNPETLCSFELAE